MTARAEEVHKIVLEADQRRAIATALTRQVSIISGGPGAWQDHGRPHAPVTWLRGPRSRAAPDPVSADSCQKDRPLGFQRGESPRDIVTADVHCEMARL